MKVLLAVDLQNDFFEGGALNVSGSNKIVSVVNSLFGKFPMVVFSNDVHPEDHSSFVENHKNAELFAKVGTNGSTKTILPKHCVEGTKGAEINEQIEVPDDRVWFFPKGTNPKIDNFSAFFDANKKSSTGLHEFLKDKKIEEVYVCGISFDSSIKNTALDASKLGYDVHVICDAVASQSFDKKTTKKTTLDELKDLGIKIVRSTEL